MFCQLIFILISIVSCKSDTIPEEYGYLYNNNYIRDTILYQIEIETIGNKHLFIINENTLQESEISNKISSINRDDIINLFGNIEDFKDFHKSRLSIERNDY